MNKLGNKGFSIVEVVIILFIIAVIGVLGWLFYNNWKNNAQPTAQTTDQQQQEDFKYDGADIPSDWKLYENAEHGFSFQYPSNFTLSQSTFELGESADNAVFAASVSPSAHPAYEVRVTKRTLDDAVQSAVFNFTENLYEDTVEQKSTFVSGHRAVEVSYIPEGKKVSWFYVEKDSETVIEFSLVEDTGSSAEESKAVYNSLVIK
jgi:Tfp pilus assembly protein PilV